MFVCLFLPYFSCIKLVKSLIKQNKALLPLVRTVGRTDRGGVIIMPSVSECFFLFPLFPCSYIAPRVRGAPLTY